MNAQKFQGKLITFEGTEGVGKTTIIKFVAEYLQQQGVEVVITREPGGTKVGDAIRSILLAKNDVNPNEPAAAIHPETEALLFFASRKQHLVEVILPNLKLGKCILCDRFIDSSYAYQGAANGVAIEKLELLEAVTLDGFKQDLTLVLDAAPEVGLDRIAARSNGNLDRIEQQQVEYFLKARTEFFARAARAKDRVVRPRNRAPCRRYARAPWGPPACRPS
jgi:dTMP kinase